MKKNKNIKYLIMNRFHNRKRKNIKYVVDLDELIPNCSNEQNILIGSTMSAKSRKYFEEKSSTLKN